MLVADEGTLDCAVVIQWVGSVSPGAKLEPLYDID